MERDASGLHLVQEQTSAVLLDHAAVLEGAQRLLRIERLLGHQLTRGVSVAMTARLGSSLVRGLALLHRSGLHLPGQRGTTSRAEQAGTALKQAAAADVAAWIGGVLGQGK